MNYSILVCFWIAKGLFIKFKRHKSFIKFSHIKVDQVLQILLMSIITMEITIRNNEERRRFTDTMKRAISLEECSRER